MFDVYCRLGTESAQRWSDALEIDDLISAFEVFAQMDLMLRVVPKSKDLSISVFWVSHNDVCYHGVSVAEMSVVVDDQSKDVFVSHGHAMPVVCMIRLTIFAVRE